MQPCIPSGPGSKGVWESSGRVTRGHPGVGCYSALLLGLNLTFIPATATWAIVGTTRRGSAG